MKRTLTVLSMLVIGAVVAQANLIVNGGFEDAPTSPWVAANGAVLSINTASANSGSQSGQIDFPDYDLANIYQNISIVPADRLLTYTLSFSVNVEGYSELIGILPAMGEWNSVDPITFQFGTHEWIAAGTTGWQTFSQDFTLSQADGTLVQPKFYFYPQGDPKAAGSLLMDDISMTVVPEPATFGLFGVIGAGMLFVRRRIMK